jgi:hypothetical protein
MELSLIHSFTLKLRADGLLRRLRSNFCECFTHGRWRKEKSPDQQQCRELFPQWLAGAAMKKLRLIAVPSLAGSEVRRLIA